MAVSRGSGLARWPVRLPEAKALQESLRKRVRVRSLRTRLRRIAGCDVSVERAADRVFAAVVLLEWPSMRRLGCATSVGRIRFPYVPGYLTFREGPVLDAAFRRLAMRPDLVIFDGQGIAHPRRCGLASHLGVVWGVPSIGCAKSRLIGEAADPGPDPGEWSPLVHEGEIVGSVLRTRRGVKPVWVSPGHRIDHAGSREIVLQACSRFRLPDATREAHLEVNRLRRKWIARRRSARG